MAERAHIEGPPFELPTAGGEPAQQGRSGQAEEDADQDDSPEEDIPTLTI